MFVVLVDEEDARRFESSLDPRQSLSGAYYLIDSCFNPSDGGNTDTRTLRNFALAQANEGPRVTYLPRPNHRVPNVKKYRDGR